MSRAGTSPVVDYCLCGERKDPRARQCRACYLIPLVEKGCSACSRTLPVAEFYRRANGTFVSHCKSCVRANGRARPREQARRYDRNSRSRPGYYKAVAARITRRRKSDPAYRLAERLRAAVRQAMNRRGERKELRIVELLGCSIGDFRSHIERQWRPGMSWANYGRNRDCWQFDHIRPVASYDLSDPEQVRACFHFSNYQPLWAPENASKRDRWDPEPSISFARH